MANILIIHGPNLNMLGQRESQWYGNTTLAAIDADLKKLSKEAKHDLTTFQSNSESEIIDKIHQAVNNFNFLIINPTGLGHTSVILRDALLCLPYPFIEVHLSNPLAREEFRHISYTTDLALGVISGLGAYGYSLALKAAINYLEK